MHGTRRTHLGVDYGAPTGTSVLAVASGVVELAGWSGEAGRMVRIRHAGGYQTAYLHLSGFGPGIRVGAHVSQGDVIGRVGMTGTATGPHLDYGVIVGESIMTLMCVALVRFSRRLVIYQALLVAEETGAQRPRRLAVVGAADLAEAALRQIQASPTRAWKSFAPAGSVTVVRSTMNAPPGNTAPGVLSA